MTIHAVMRDGGGILFHRGARGGRRDEARLYGRALLLSAISAISAMIDILIACERTPRASDRLPR